MSTSTAAAPAVKKGSPRPRTNQIVVLEWLNNHHSSLNRVVDRDWVWITNELDPKNPVEAVAIKDIEAFGFIRSKKPGGHPIKGTGLNGTWGHSCMHPVPFKRKPKAGATTTASSSGAHTSVMADPPTTVDTSVEDHELAEFLGQ
jgi:hypothetical protein